MKHSKLMKMYFLLIFNVIKGFCQLSVRIDSVSKNHNNKAFIIHVFPDLDEYPQNCDIGGCYTIPIKVKSKRYSKSMCNCENHSF